MDLKVHYLMLIEIDRTTSMLAAKLCSQAKTEPDDRIAAAEAILMLQNDRKLLVKLLVEEIMKGAYGAKI